jgi:hypothetical protein
MQACGAPSGAPGSAPGLRARRSSTAVQAQPHAAAAPPAPPPPAAPLPAALAQEADALVRGRYQEYMATRIALSNQARRGSSRDPSRDVSRRFALRPTAAPGAALVLRARSGCRHAPGCAASPFFGWA